MSIKENNAVIVIPEKTTNKVQFEILNDSGSTYTRKYRPFPRFKIHMPLWIHNFIRSHGISMSILAFLTVWTLSCVVITRAVTTTKVTKRLTVEFNAQLESYARTLEAQKQTESLLTGDASKRVAIEEAATIMAKSFYGHRDVISTDNDLYTIGWVEWFRVVSGGEFANQTTLEEVVSRPNAFMGYSENNPIIESHFNIAKQICTEYFEGRWPTSEKFVYFDWSQGKVIARNDFKTNARTEYWWWGK